MPTETTAQRLIDANALIVKINSDIDGESTMAKRALVRTVTELLESSPTVETTDDVLASIPYPCKIVKTVTNVGTRYFGKTIENETRFFDTPLEAVKKLEASLNPK